VKELSIPVILLVVLVALMAGSLVPLTRNQPKLYKPVPGLAPTHEKLVEQAEGFLKTASFTDALNLLEPLRASPDPRLQLALLEAQAGLGRHFPDQVASLVAHYTRENKFEPLFRLAGVYESGGEFAAAQRLYAELTGKAVPRPLVVPLYSRLGSVSARAGLATEAIQAWSRVVREDASRPEPFAELFKLLAREKRAEELADLRAVGDQHHLEQFGYHWALGQAYVGLNQLDEAARCFTRCAKISPDDIEVRVQLYLLYRRQNKTRESLTVLGSLLPRITALPRSCGAPSSCGIARMNRGRSTGPIWPSGSCAPRCSPTDRSSGSTIAGFSRRPRAGSRRAALLKRRPSCRCSSPS
jgi:tetratricopeptide (TPR) repeat protein